MSWNVVNRCWLLIILWVRYLWMKYGRRMTISNLQGKLPTMRIMRLLLYSFGPRNQMIPRIYQSSDLCEIRQRRGQLRSLFTPWRFRGRMFWQVRSCCFDYSNVFFFFSPVRHKHAIPRYPSIKPSRSTYNLIDWELLDEHCGDSTSSSTSCHSSTTPMWTERYAGMSFMLDSFRDRITSTFF